MRLLRATLAAGVVMGLALAALSNSVLAQSTDCMPKGGLNFVCGIQAAEDLVPVPNSRWLITSGMQAGSGLHAVDTQAHTARNLFAAATTPRPDRAKFANCPSPLDPKQALLHGLSLRPLQGQNGRYTLYATNHGGRESVEVYELDASGAAPTVTWVGCVLMPDKLPANSVAAFRDGTLVTTVVTLPGKTFQELFAGKNTGAVFMWTPGSAAFRQLPGTELAGNNGIETSADDTEFFVASSGSKRITAYARANPSKPLRFAQLKEYAPDNVRMVGNRLVAAGMIDAEPACGGAPQKPEDIQCARGWIADAIDPKTMAVTEIGRGPSAAPYKGTATAIPLGNEIWLSSFNSDRVAYRALNRK